MPRIDVGQSTMLQVVGDFEDQLNVVLPGSYLEFASTNPAAGSISLNGALPGISNGTSANIVSTHGLQAATAFGIGAPANAFEKELYESGVSVYPQSLSLAVGSGTRQLRITILVSIEVSSASAGTNYFVSQPSIVSVTPDGLVSGLLPGVAVVTVINGAAEVLIPVIVEEPRPGPAIVGSLGGVVQAEDGTLLLIAPDSLQLNTVVEIAPVAETDLPLSLPEPFEFLGAFHIDFANHPLSQPVQVAVPVPSGTPPGTEVYFFRHATLPAPNGQTQSLWLLVEFGVVGTDGMARTSSPPYPGLG